MVDIRWNEGKNAKLKAERGVAFTDAADCILKGKYIILTRNRIQGQQKLYLVSIRDYTYAVPYVYGRDESIFLKTIYPSRKFHRAYGVQLK